MIIDGKKIASGIIDNLMKLPKPQGALAAVLVGNNTQSRSFLKQKEKIARVLGIDFRLYEFDEMIGEKELINKIEKLGGDVKIGGIIVQLPLPEVYSRDKILEAVCPEKDVDVLVPETRKKALPLAVGVVKDVLTSVGMDIKDRKIAVIGSGFLVGGPVMRWLNEMGKNFELFDEGSNLAGLKKADLVISGVGKGGLIKPQMLKPDAIVIDFGYDSAGGKLKGDFDVSDTHNSLSVIRNSFSYTPTPGGTGPVLVAEIFKNFYKLNK